MVGVVISGRHRIPVRNIWLLMLYASDLFRQLDGNRRAGVEDNPDDIPDLIAEILAYEVERRLARNLSMGWRTREADLNRVRGRVNLSPNPPWEGRRRGELGMRKPLHLGECLGGNWDRCTRQTFSDSRT